LQHRLTDDAQVVAALPDIHINFLRQDDGTQHTWLNGEDIEKAIRTLEVGNRASQVSQIKEVRQFLVEQQQAMGKDKGIVMDGRDIGTVVFPQAELKLFLTASPEVRAQRRFKELQDKNPDDKTLRYEDVLRDVNDRDYRDTHRTESPLRQAEDAVVVDNSNLTPDQQSALVCNLLNERLAAL
jgi:cytidylate kinase